MSIPNIPGRSFEVTNEAATAITVLHAALVISAHASRSLLIYASDLGSNVATSFQIECQWHKVTTLGAGINRGTTKTRALNVLDAGNEGFTVIGDISVEPTTYDADEIYENLPPSPSSIGYHSHQEPNPSPIFIPRAEIWALRIINATFAEMTPQVRVLVHELPA